MRHRLAGLALASAVLLSACADPLEGKFGEELYREACAHCHGVDLSGGTGPAVGAGSNSDVKLTDHQLADVIRIGPGSMPGFGHRLSDGQIASLVDYMRLRQRGAEGE